MAGFLFLVVFVLLLGVASALGWTVDSREPGARFFAAPPERPRRGELQRLADYQSTHPSALSDTDEGTRS